ncbi:hypothetical protein AZI86_07115 [Bdellovibrio bacteriovorus]|uniref:Uncharacterized protein n=1 Tax=Bdellovibrio bacteriovorus TaxID=959 RepID=A0A150WQV0_BDEBC|nr:hypothetical protein [Bdellovibrio bacteriovorus]KYG66800.1 hypothetical protein AZI86_07115 [Bdellovibrio bacteriovorus]
MISFIKDGPTDGLLEVVETNSFIRCSVDAGRSRFVTSLTRLLDTGFKPTIVTQDRLNAAIASGSVVPAIRSIDQVYVQLIGTNSSEGEKMKRLIDSILVARTSYQVPYIQLSPTEVQSPILKNKFNHCYVTPHKGSPKPTLCVGFKFNPTVQVLNGFRDTKFWKKYTTPRAAASGAIKRNLFLPQYLQLPDGFNFASEVRSCLEDFETDLGEVASLIDLVADFEITWSLKIIQAEFYTDYLTEDPAGTYFRLASFTPYNGAAPVESYNNKRQFLSVVTYNGEKNICTEERYCALTAFPKADNTHDSGAVVRYEIRKYLGRKGSNLIVEFPDLNDLSTHATFNMRWLIVDYLRMVLKPLRLSDNNFNNLLVSGRTDCASPSFEVTNELLDNQGIGNLITIKYYTKSGPPTKSGKINHHPRISLILNSRAYEVMYATGIFSDILIGKVSKVGKSEFKSLDDNSSEYFRRELKRVIDLKKNFLPEGATTVKRKRR